MKRQMALIVAILLFSGCSSQAPPASDPFFGRTRVAPSPTGSVSGQQPGPYYRGNVSPVPNGRSSPWPKAAAASPSPNGPTPTPARRSPVALAAGSIPRPVDDTAGGQQPRGGTLAGREPVIRIIEPRPAPSAGLPAKMVSHPPTTAGPQEPRRLDVPGRVVDIMELPPAGSSRSSATAKAGGFRLASADDGPDGPSAATTGDVTTEGFAPRVNYGHGPKYEWLRGKLEHSQIDRRWKLRYIPVDGKTDRFGGSVVLSNPSVLSGFERGEFVKIQGKIGPPDPKKGFAPVYEVTGIERLGGAAP